ncbi:MAG TPA: hypothetical protein VHB98_10125, partial [Chloroflexota bacterium]|nr:hypothetical protein [Chloroflexota bacterium]
RWRCCALIDVQATGDERSETERSLSWARDALGERHFALAWEEGKDLGPDRAVQRLCNSYLRGRQGPMP